MPSASSPAKERIGDPAIERASLRRLLAVRIARAVPAARVADGRRRTQSRGERRALLLRRRRIGATRRRRPVGYWRAARNR